jgi:hypothetical protein
MIQRIQTVYLFLTTLLSLLFLQGSFLKFSGRSGSVMEVTLRGIYKINGGQVNELIDKVIPLTLVIIVIPVLCLTAIFLFKNRRIQMLLAIILVVLVAAFIAGLFCYSWLIINRYDCVLVPGYKMLIPVFMLILCILAYKGIRKDEDLIKSYDRLR